MQPSLNKLLGRLKVPDENLDSALCKRVIDNFSEWILCRHGRVMHLKYYLGEYCYRYNRHKKKEGLVEELGVLMVLHQPASYKALVRN